MGAAGRYRKTSAKEKAISTAGLKIANVARIAFALLLALAAFEFLSAVARNDRPWPPSTPALMTRAAALGADEKLARSWKNQLRRREPNLLALKQALGTETDPGKRTLVAQRVLDMLDSGRREEGVRLLAGLTRRARDLGSPRLLRPVVAGSSVKAGTLGASLARIAQQRHVDRPAAAGSALLLDAFRREALCWLAADD